MILLTELRQQTQFYHEKIEQNHLLKQITDKKITRTIYIVLLKKLLGYWCAIVNQLQMRNDMNFYVSGKARLDWLKKDLLALGETSVAVNIVQLCSFIPILHTYASCLGCLYVLEGSMLGGKILAKLLYETLAIDADTGCAYFSGYGKETHVIWQGFCNYLQPITKRNEQQQVITAAIETFKTLDQWLLR